MRPRSRLRGREPLGLAGRLKVLFNGMLSRDLVRRLSDRTAATELYLREHATEIEQISTSNERHLEA